MPVLLDTPHYYMEQLPNGIVFVIVRGDFNEDIIDDFAKASEEHIKRLAPMLYMNDISQSGDSNLASKWKLQQLMKSRAHLIKRSAVFGAHGVKRFLLQSLLRASDRSEVAKIFDTREEAERWLLS